MGDTSITPYPPETAPVEDDPNLTTDDAPAEPPFPTFGNYVTGQLAPPLLEFVAVKELEKFCDSYVELSHLQKVKEVFFGRNLYERHWDIFYIYPPNDIHADALLVFPAPQVTHFLWEINTKFHIRLKLPSNDFDSAMILSNYDDGAPRPRFIHGSTDYVDWDLLKFSIPLRGYRANNGPSEAGEKEPSVEAWTAYRYQMLCMTDEAKKRKLEARKKRAVTRHARQQKLNHELKRVQRYLGLRQSKAGEMTDLSAMSDAAKVDEVGLGVKETSLEEAKSVPRMDLNEKVVFPMESNVIFISVDVELYEMNKQLTEIGFATLDTSDIAGVPPGENGSNWFKHIRARHFAIEERRHMQNKKFCDSNLFGFNFGETEWIRALEVPQKIADCFKPPYSKAAAWKDEWRSQPKRNLVFVGHDARQDNEALQKNGYDPSNLSNLVDVADTAHMFQSLTRSPQLSKLSNVLQSVGLSGYNFHNAGNDAAYTMQAMIGIAIKSAAEKEDRKAAKRDDLLKRLHHAMNNAVEVAKEGQEGWSSDDSDGGEAPPPFEPLVEKQKADIEAAPVETDAKPPNKDVTMGKGVCIPDQNGHPIPADGGNVMDKPSWRSQALTAKVEVKPISEPVQMVVIPKPVVKSNPYAELEAEDSDNVYTSNMLSQEMIDADFDMGYDPDNDKQEEPTQDDFPLQCTICPKSPWFPTIDNLYAHLGSKNHLKHRHDIDLVAKHDKAARKLLTEYELWYARNKLYDKLADRAAKNLITGPPTVNKETGKVTTGVTPPKPALKKSDKDVLMPLSQASVGKETLSTQTGASAEPAGKSAAKENPDNDTKNLEAERTTVMSGQTDGGNNEKRPVTRRCTRFIRRVEEKRDE